MVLTGPPGTGKTMTAGLIGEAMMKSLERVEGGNFEWRMEGVLIIK
jgi:Holliday junction resolvasome RuvABC ATP-dependent DNA helicase subunit